MYILLIEGGHICVYTCISFHEEIVNIYHRTNGQWCYCGAMSSITTLLPFSVQSLPEGAKVVRCMPSTPVVVRNGVTVYSRKGTVGEDDKDVVQHMLASVGLGVEMPEHYMDTITGLTGCGPSYVSN